MTSRWSMLTQLYAHSAGPKDETHTWACAVVDQNNTWQRVICGVNVRTSMIWDGIPLAATVSRADSLGSRGFIGIIVQIE